MQRMLSLATTPAGATHTLPLAQPKSLQPRTIPNCKEKQSWVGSPVAVVTSLADGFGKPSYKPRHYPNAAWVARCYRSC